MKKIIISFFAILFCLTTTAQQGTNFSMWFHNNLQHNPASVATNDNDLRVFANFRYQYFTVTSKPFQTISATGEIKLLKSKERNGYLGVGASIINDMSGDGRYMVNDISVPVAYHIYFNENNSLSIGVSPGIYQRSLGGGNLTWESQWNGYQFEDAHHAEPLGNTSLTNFDLGAGLFYKFEASNRNQVYFGVSAKHILEPPVNFNIEDNLHRRYIAQFGMRHRFDLSYFGISPNVLAVIQGPNQSFVFGSNFDFYLQDPSLRTLFYTPTVFSFGVYHRYFDAIILNFQYSFKGMTIALAYDSNINSMIPASKSVGGLEIAFLYDIMLNKRNRFIY